MSQPASSGEAGPHQGRSGAAMFARFAFPPNDLGHCGPPGSEQLLASGAAVRADAAGDAAGDPEVRARVPQFDGAWPYLQLLAATAGLGDVLAAEVVSAYWLGGELLDAVDPVALRATVKRGFRGQPGVAERLADTPDALTAGAGASHGFHVFVVYPWVGLLGPGSDVPRSVLDSCRVRWGTVESVGDEKARVVSRPLTWDGTSLGLGAERAETCRWTRGRHAFVRELKPGHQVALHWDWICDRLDDPSVAELTDRTQRQLTSTNAWLAQRSHPT
ncbi:MAG: hypothetical protein H0V32_07030 [Nocardioidaceae bacterium]|nr:hypothetical protein [Nocardioidaceae bacterium]